MNDINIYEQRLMEAILSKSKSQIYKEAKLEWHVASIRIGNYQCACGKNPIKKLCFLYNKVTYDYLIVGSSCVKKYLNIDTNQYFKEIELLRKGKLLGRHYFSLIADSANLSEWERGFYENMYEFNRISSKQQTIIDKINTKILTTINNTESVLDKFPFGKV